MLCLCLCGVRPGRCLARHPLFVGSAQHGSPLGESALCWQECAFYMWGYVLVPAMPASDTASPTDQHNMQLTLLIASCLSPQAPAILPQVPLGALHVASHPWRRGTIVVATISAIGSAHPHTARAFHPSSWIAALRYEHRSSCFVAAHKDVERAYRVSAPSFGETSVSEAMFLCRSSR